MRAGRGWGKGRVPLKTAGPGNCYSGTSGTRPDAGMARRLDWLVSEAVRQYGVERVARYLQVPADPAQVKSPGEILGLLTRRGLRHQEPAGTVFSRFLN